VRRWPTGQPGGGQEDGEVDIVRIEQRDDASAGGSTVPTSTTRYSTRPASGARTVVSASTAFRRATWASDSAMAARASPSAARAASTPACSPSSAIRRRSRSTADTCPSLNSLTVSDHSSRAMRWRAMRALVSACARCAASAARAVRPLRPRAGRAVPRRPGVPLLLRQPAHRLRARATRSRGRRT
jgi:hypothetical protein